MKKHNVDGKHYIKLWLVYMVNYEQQELIKIKSSLKNSSFPILLQTSEWSVLEGETLSIGGSFSSLFAECLRGGTGLIVWVMTKEMGRSLSRMFSCTEGKCQIKLLTKVTAEKNEIVN